jgi:hypothetical protein
VDDPGSHSAYRSNPCRPFVRSGKATQALPSLLPDCDVPGFVLQRAGELSADQQEDRTPPQASAPRVSLNVAAELDHRHGYSVLRVPALQEAVQRSHVRPVRSLTPDLAGVLKVECGLLGISLTALGRLVGSPFVE